MCTWWYGLQGVGGIYICFSCNIELCIVSVLMKQHSMTGNDVSNWRHVCGKKQRPEDGSRWYSWFTVCSWCCVLTHLDKLLTIWQTVTIIIIIIIIIIIGPINEAEHSFLSGLGRRLSTISDDPRESFLLFQRIFILIQRFNEVALRGTFDAETGHDE